MANMRISFKNLLKDATLSASPALLAGHTESELLLDDRSNTARSTSLATQDIKASWPTTQTARVIADGSRNFTSAAQRRPILYPNADFTGTPTHDPGAGDCNNYSNLSSHFVMTDTENRIRNNHASYFAAKTFKSFLSRYTDAANPDGFFDLAWLWIGDYMEFTYQPPEGGAPMKPKSLSSSSLAYSGSTVTDKGANGFELPISHNFMPDSDVKDLVAMLDYVGSDRLVWVSVFPEEGSWREKYHQGICKIREASAVDCYRYGLTQGGFVFEAQ